MAIREMHKSRIVIYILAGSLSVATVPAMANCASMKTRIDHFLSNNARWSVLDIGNLPDDDKSLWMKNHGNSCPGIASVYLDGKGREVFAIALLSESDHKTFEKLVLVKPYHGGILEYQLVEPKQITTPFVVWRGEPGKFYDYKTSKTVVIKHDSIVYEKMESISIQFYSKNGKIHSLLAAN